VQNNAIEKLLSRLEKLEHLHVGIICITWTIHVRMLTTSQQNLFKTHLLQCECSFHDIL